MALPVIPLPTYITKIPSIGQSITFSPFTVGQETALLTAQDSGDISTITATIKQVLSEVIKTPIDIDTFASFDIEFLILQVRAKSVGEIIELGFNCDSESCLSLETPTTITAELNLDDVQVKFRDIEKKIKLSDDVGIVLKYPSLSTMQTIQTSDNEIEVLSTCIDYIYSPDSKWTQDDYTPEELSAFLLGLPKQTYNKIEKNL